jgi:hypothetical protein
MARYVSIERKMKEHVGGQGISSGNRSQNGAFNCNEMTE